MRLNTCGAIALVALMAVLPSNSVHAVKTAQVEVELESDKKVTYQEPKDPEGQYALEIRPKGSLELNNSWKVLPSGQSLWELKPENKSQDLHKWTVSCPGELPPGILIKGNFDLPPGGAGPGPKNQFMVDVQETVAVAITNYPATRDHLASNMTIEYTISPTADFTADSAKLEVIDSANVVVHTNSTIDKTGGSHSVEWDGKDTAGNWVNPGTFTLKITIEYGVLTRSDQKQAQVNVKWQPGFGMQLWAHNHDTESWENDGFRYAGNYVGLCYAKSQGAPAACAQQSWSWGQQYFGMSPGEWYCGYLILQCWREIKHNDQPSKQERIHMRVVDGELQQGWRYIMIEEKYEATGANWNEAVAGGEDAITEWYNTYMLRSWETITPEEFTTQWLNYTD